MKVPIKVKNSISLRSKVGIRFCISKTPKKIRAAIPYLTKARDRGSLSSIIKRVNTTVMPPRDVESDAQKTPQRTVLRTGDDTEEDGVIKCWYVNGCFGSNGENAFGQAKIWPTASQWSYSICSNLLFDQGLREESFPIFCSGIIWYICRTLKIGEKPPLLLYTLTIWQIYQFYQYPLWIL